MSQFLESKYWLPGVAMVGATLAVGVVARMTPLHAAPIALTFAGANVVASMGAHGMEYSNKDLWMGEYAKSAGIGFVMGSVVDMTGVLRP